MDNPNRQFRPKPSRKPLDGDFLALAKQVLGDPDVISDPGDPRLGPDDRGDGGDRSPLDKPPCPRSGAAALYFAEVEQPELVGAGAGPAPRFV